jgi:hypothetical protein
MRVALFVEGSTGEVDREGNDFFIKLWKTALVTALGLRDIDFVFPISKKHIIALNPQNPRMSGASEALDEFMARKLRSDSFDAAVVAWDLHPSWEGASATACRWNETLEFYRLLAASTALPEPWVRWANSKANDLSSRGIPSDRRARPQLCPHATFAVCMEPVFEALLLGSERGIKRALGVDNMRVPGWPNWNTVASRPELVILQTAILSAKSLVPKKRDAHLVAGDMRTAKHAWATRFVEQLAGDTATRDELLRQPIARRLIELLPPAATSGRRR